MRLPCLFQPRILRIALKALFGRPYTSEFPAKPFEASERFRGRVRYDEEECIGCGACAEVCPANCIDVTDEAEAETPARHLVQHLDQCIWCGQCERYCTTEKGIRQTNEHETAGFALEDFRETCDKELLLCECCGGIIAPVDQIRWLARRLGPLAFTNPTLMLVAHDQLNVVDPGVADPDPDHVGRSRRVSIQCPSCRRNASLTV